MAKTRTFLDTMTLDQVCDLERDNFEVGDFWVMRDGPYIVVAEQKLGEPSKAKMHIPLRVMRRIVKELLTPRKLVARK